ncbi:MAG: MarR family transcriptional regulator [Actinomycetota bacterium]|nr:MarR family transcriptional regulator [Actinomycetota bacterium]
MATSHQRGHQQADLSAVSVTSCSDGDGVVADDSAAAVTTADVDWFIARLRSMVTASSAVWAGRGMTLLQLVALQFISALAPVTVSGLAQVLGTRPPATSAMVDRLARAGLVRRSPDPQDRRRVELTTTSAAQPIVGDTDEDTAQRLSAVVHAMSAQIRRPLIDLLVETVRRLAEESTTPLIRRATSESGPLTVRAGDGHNSEATAKT